jgi:hypothetical protein
MNRLINALYIAVGITAAILFASCAEEEEFAAQEPRELSISAIMEGFNSDASTRIYNQEDNSYFTSGDSIGIIAIGNGGDVKSDVSNVKATYDGSKWTAASKIYLYANTTYVAYAPYNAALDMTKISSAADIAKQHNVGNDGQSTREEYLKADLLVASAGVLSNNNITFSFRHAFSLIEIVLPRKCYRLTSSGGGIRLPNYYVQAGSLYYLSGINMYSPTPGAYRCIVAPGSKVGISGGYTDTDDKIHDFNYYPYSGAIAAGCKYTAYIDRDNEESSSSLFTYSQGDYFMNDGTIISKSKGLTSTQKKNCIGVIFYVNDPSSRFGDAEREALTAMGSTPHGYVMSLRDATLTVDDEEESSFAWHTNEVFDKDISEIADVKTLEECKNDVNGLSNTGYMMQYITEEGVVTSALRRFREENPRPANTTEWFIPSTGQWFDLINKLSNTAISDSDYETAYDYAYRTRLTTSGSGSDYIYEKINNKMKDIGYDYFDRFEPDYSYWTSNEVDGAHARQTTFEAAWKDGKVYNSQILFGYRSKQATARVRCILAF